MPYVTLDQVKRYLGQLHGEDVDDVLLEECIDRAQASIEEETNNVFEAVRMGRLYSVTPPFVFPGFETELHLDTLLIKAYRVENAGTVLGPSDYVLWPQNLDIAHSDWEGRWMVRRVDGNNWTYTGTNPYNQINIKGLWGATRHPSARCVHATCRLAAYFYKQKDAQVFDVTAMFEGGALAIPQGFPKGVWDFINANRKVL